MPTTHTRTVWIVVGVLVLIVLAVAFLPVFSSVRSAFGILFAPQAVRNTAYIGVEGNERGVIYSLGMFSVERQAFDGYSVADYVRDGVLGVAILRDDSGSYDVYDISSGTPVRLTSDGREKTSLDLSADGTQVAYGVKARALPLPVGATEDDIVYQLEEWDVEIIDLQSKVISYVGPGNHPRFYQEGLFYPAPTGLIYRIPGEDGFDELDEGSVLVDLMAYRITQLALFTNDGVAAFPSVALPAYDAFKVAAVSPSLLLEPLPEHPIQVPRGTTDLLSYGGGYFTLTQLQDGRRAVVRLGEDSFRPVFVFPAGFIPELFVSID